MFRTLLPALCLACIAFSAKAHEFWIDPERHVVDPGGSVVAAIRVGQRYKGGSYSYLPPQFRRFDYAIDGRIAPVPGRMGDRPAVNMPAPGEGLLVLIHETTDFRLAWDSWEEFEAFVRHKDAAWTLAAHDARRLSREDVTEAYSRYAKALVAIGGGEGADVEAGLETEFVALENPYTDDVSDGVDVQLFYQGTPRAEAQIEVFEKDGENEVTVFTVRTDADGRATIPVRPGRRYMLDAVVLREPSDDLAASRDVVWESLWANLTFEAPAR